MSYVDTVKTRASLIAAARSNLEVFDLLVAAYKIRHFGKFSAPDEESARVMLNASEAMSWIVEGYKPEVQ